MPDTRNLQAARISLGDDASFSLEDDRDAFCRAYSFDDPDACVRGPHFLGPYGFDKSLGGIVLDGRAKVSGGIS